MRTDDHVHGHGVVFLAIKFNCGLGKSWFGLVGHTRNAVISRISRPASPDLANLEILVLPRVKVLEHVHLLKAKCSYVVRYRSYERY